jgi:hypothetical protein
VCFFLNVYKKRERERKRESEKKRNVWMKQRNFFVVGCLPVSFSVLSSFLFALVDIREETRKEKSTQKWFIYFS